MRVHTRIVLDWNGNVLADDWHDHDGPVMLAKGGSSTPQTVVQKTESGPPEFQKPYLETGFKKAKEQLESDKPQFFPGSTVTPFSPETETALGMRTAQATDPNSLIGQAATETGRTLSGYHLTPDSPAYGGLLRGVSDIVRPQVGGQFAGAGRGTGSPGYQEAVARGITTGMLPFIGAERDRMAAATQTALPVSQYAPGLLSSVGAEREGLGRETLQEAIDRFNFEQNIEQQKLSQYMGNVSGGYGGTGTSTATQPVYRSPLMTGLGAASSLAGIGSAALGPGFLNK